MGSVIMSRPGLAEKTKQAGGGLRESGSRLPGSSSLRDEIQESRPAARRRRWEGGTA